MSNSGKIIAAVCMLIWLTFYVYDSYIKEDNTVKRSPAVIYACSVDEQSYILLHVLDTNTGHIIMTGNYKVSPVGDTVYVDYVNVKGKETPDIKFDTAKYVTDAPKAKASILMDCYKNADFTRK